MTDLMTLAFRTDMTRVVTVLLAIEQSPRNYPEIKQFTYLLDKFKSIRDGDGTLLDNSMIVYRSGLADGNQHQHHNLPAVAAGRGRVTLRPGRHVRDSDETPMANLFLSMLDRMGVPADKWGDSTGRLEGLSDLQLSRLCKSGRIR
jgi:hypothetical protein